MTDFSVSAIDLPQISTNGLANRMAKKALIQILQSISIGSIKIHDGEETLSFGSDTDPSHPHAELRVHNPLVYRQLLLGGNVGAGESYMQGHWSSSNLTQVIRVFTANMSVLESVHFRSVLGSPMI